MSLWDSSQQSLILTWFTNLTGAQLGQTTVPSSPACSFQASRRACRQQPSPVACSAPKQLLPQVMGAMDVFGYLTRASQHAAKPFWHQAQLGQKAIFVTILLKSQTYVWRFYKISTSLSLGQFCFHTSIKQNSLIAVHVIHLYGMMPAGQIFSHGCAVRASFSPTGAKDLPLQQKSQLCIDYGDLWGRCRGNGSGALQHSRQTI